MDTIWGSFTVVGQLQWHWFSTVSSRHNGNPFNQEIKPLNKGNVSFNEATILCLTVVASIEVFNWGRELSDAVILFKMAAGPAWVLCTVGKIVMVSFHLNCSDSGLYWFLPRSNYYRHKRASFSYFPSLFHKSPILMLLASLWVDEDILLLLHPLQELIRMENPILNDSLQ